MERVPVTSSNCASVGYDAATRMLEIEFRGGAVYQYFDVPASAHAGLMSASSIGSYLDAHIKKAGYRYEKL